MATTVTWPSGGFTIPDFMLQTQAPREVQPGGEVLPSMVDISQQPPGAYDAYGQPLQPQVQQQPYNEPLIRPGDIVLGVVGLLASNYRGLLWGAAVADVAGRQVSEQYRYYAFQYFHHFFNF